MERQAIDHKKLQSKNRSQNVLDGADWSICDHSARKHLDGAMTSRENRVPFPARVKT